MTQQQLCQGVVPQLDATHSQMPFDQDTIEWEKVAVSRWHDGRPVPNKVDVNGQQGAPLQDTIRDYNRRHAFK